MTATYFFPPDNSRSRAVSLVPWSTGLLLPRWYGPPEVWTYTGGVLASAAMSLASTCGFSAAATDGASGAWMTQYTGSLVHYTSGAVETDFNLPSGKVFTGCAYVSSYAKPYVISSDGYVYAGSSLTLLNAGLPLGQNNACWGLAVSGTTLFSLTGSGAATFSLTSSGAGTNGFVTVPMDGPLCLAASTAASALAVGGWEHTVIPHAYVNMACAPSSPLVVGVGGTVNNRIDLYIGVHERWVLNQTQSGQGNPVAACFSANNNQLFVTDPTFGVVQIYRYSLGSLILYDNVFMGAPSGVAVTPDNGYALITRPTLDVVTPLLRVGNNWVQQDDVPLTGATSVLALASGTAAVGYTSGLALLTLLGGSWTVSATGALPFTPTALAAASGLVFAAGSDGASGYFSAVSGVTPQYTYTWPGSGRGVVYEQGQVAVSDPTTPNFYVFGNLFDVYQYAAVEQPLVPFNNIVISPYTKYSNGGTIFAMASGATYLYEFTAPYNLDPQRSGQVSIMTSGVWANCALGSGQVPTALTFGSNNHVYAATLNNTLVEITTAGSLVSSGTIVQFPLQLQTAPLGVSSLSFLGANLYGASSLAGPLVELF